MGELVINNTLVYWVVGYLIVSIMIGLLAGRRVHSSTDYMSAGRSLPIYVVIATVFATWFGSETVLGTSSTFITDGMSGIVADPFGAGLCLILVGLFFAVKLYRMKLLTIADYYRVRYGKDVEFITSVAILLSYLGWVAAQLVALGLVFNLLSGGALTTTEGTILGAGIVILYTIYGGMWSVALTDFFQMCIIVLGLVAIFFVITAQVDGGAMAVVEHASASGKLNFFPEHTWTAGLGFVGALVTLGLGSIPQQDVFQRVMSGKSEKIARDGAVWGGIFYLIFAMIPIFLAYAAFMIDPAMVNAQLGEGGDSQKVLPTLILTHTPVIFQVLFFGALLSAIMSTASGTLLAPSTIFSTNILKPLLERFFGQEKDAQLLKQTRIVVLFFGVFVTIFAILKADVGIFGLVENAYKITLVGAFVPLVFGLYWKKANANGARLSIFLGIASWLICEWLDSTFMLNGAEMTEWARIGLPQMAGVCPPQLTGLFFAFIGMIIGSCLPISTNTQVKDVKHDV